MKAPFPWFGGKARASRLIWDRLGDVPNYVEPFAGSLAVLLGRPHSPGLEIVNDLDCFIANFWRAIRADPDAVAEWADGPINEADLEARHQWLVTRTEFRERMKTDPEHFDAKVAGWWVWGCCAWIGRDWGAGGGNQLPNIGRRGAVGVHRRNPGEDSRGFVAGMFAPLSDRLRDVRVVCGDWSRVLTPGVTTTQGLTGVLLDPPYSADLRPLLYTRKRGKAGVARAVQEWAVQHGDDPLLRIALCGYDEEHEFPDGWTCVAWKAAGGYSAPGGRAAENAGRERVWFSPHCLPAAPPLFAGLEESDFLCHEFPDRP